MAESYTLRNQHQTIHAFWLDYEYGRPVLYYVDTLAGDLIFRTMHYINYNLLNNQTSNKILLGHITKYLQLLTNVPIARFLKYQDFILKGVTSLRNYHKTQSSCDIMLNIARKTMIPEENNKMRTYAVICTEYLQTLLTTLPNFFNMNYYRPDVTNDTHVDLFIYETKINPLVTMNGPPTLFSVTEDNIRGVIESLYKHTFMFYTNEQTYSCMHFESDISVMSDATPEKFNFKYDNIVHQIIQKQRFGRYAYCCTPLFWITFLCGL